MTFLSEDLMVYLYQWRNVSKVTLFSKRIKKRFKFLKTKKILNLRIFNFEFRNNKNEIYIYN